MKLYSAKLRWSQTDSDNVVFMAEDENAARRILGIHGARYIDGLREVQPIGRLKMLLIDQAAADEYDEPERY